MEQILFVLRDGKISQWDLSHDKLLPVTDRGRRAVPYSLETANRYWADWKENNLVEDGDVYDAIFLSQGQNDFGELPKWICANSTDKSAWTFEQLSLLSNEVEFASGVCLIQGKTNRFIVAEKIEDAIKLCLKSSLAFTLPKEATKPKTIKPKESKESATADKASSTELQNQSSVNVLLGNSYNDPKALSLKVGDRIICTIASVRPMREFCYLKSDKASELIRVALIPAKKTLSARGSIFEMNNAKKLAAEVIAVKDKVVEYKVVI